MKNNLKLFIFVIFFIILSLKNSLSDEFEFEASEIQILNNGNIIKATEKVKITSDNNIEIIVLDDESDNDTFSLVKKISQEDNRLRVVKGTSVPKSWTGKNWACHQLSKLAKGDFYLFVDADTKLQATLIKETISEMKSSDIDLLSLFPRRITSTLVDKIISITIGWLIFSCLPLLLADKNPMFSSAFGQFLLFRRGAYKSIGGHEGIKSKILDDFYY